MDMHKFIGPVLPGVQQSGMGGEICPKMDFEFSSLPTVE